jgi:hypothetical protein
VAARLAEAEAMREEVYRGLEGYKRVKGRVWGRGLATKKRRCRRRP